MKSEILALIDLCKAVGVPVPDSVRADQQQASALIARCIAAIQPGPGPTPGPVDLEGMPHRHEVLDDYLQYLEYTDINEEAAREYFASHDVPVPAACSSLAAGVFMMRNLDWYYSEMSDIVVRTTPTDATKHKVLGVAGGFKSITDAANLGDGSLLHIVPFQLYDGFNDAGLMACYNVVPTDIATAVAEPLQTCEDEVYALMLVRYILDRFTDAKTAAEYIRDHVRVRMGSNLLSSGYALHVMVSANEQTYILEFTEGHTKLIEHNIMTNFNLYGVTLNRDGKVNTPASDERPSANGITQYGQGLERYNMIVDYLAGREAEHTTVDLATLKQLAAALNFSNAYPTAPGYTRPWYTEFTGESTGLTVDSLPADFTDILIAAGNAYTARDRSDPKTWCTTHTSIYDWTHMVMYIVAQEKAEYLTIRF